MEQYNTDAFTSYRKLLKYYRIYEKYMNSFDENNPTSDNSLQAFGKIRQLKQKMQAEYENIKNGAGVESEAVISNFVKALLKKGVIKENKNTMKKQLNERIEPRHLEFLEEFIAGSYMDIAAGKKTFKDAFNEFLNFVKVPFTPAELKKLQTKGRKILLQTEKEYDDLFDEIGGFDSADYRQNYYENKKRTIKLTESKLKSIITECIKQTLKENQENLPHGVSDIQNELVEIKRIVDYLVNDYLDSISQEQLDELGDMTQKYFQFLSGFMKKIDVKRW